MNKAIPCNAEAVAARFYFTESVNSSIMKKLGENLLKPREALDKTSLQASAASLGAGGYASKEIGARGHARFMWTRALPGSVAMIAAMTVPELSVGAGELADGLPISRPSPTPRLVPRQDLWGEAQAETGKPNLPVLASVPVEPVTYAAIAIARPLPAEVQLSKGIVAAATEQGADDASQDWLATPEDSAPDPTFPNPALTSSVESGQSNLDLAGLAAGTAEPLVALASPEANAADFVQGVDPAPTDGMQAGNLPVTDLPVAVSSPLPESANSLPIAASANLAKIETAPLAKPGRASPVEPARPQPANPAVAAAPAPAMAVPSQIVAKTASSRKPRSQALTKVSLPDIKSQLLTRVDGKTAGTVDFQQTSTGLAVRIGSLAELLSDRFEPALINRIRASVAQDTYLPLSQLQAAGIPISYDPVYDEFNVGMLDTRPKAAHKVHMDQISSPERGLGSIAIDQLRR